MKDTRMKVLENCKCGAHRYLSIRERKKALSIYLAHVKRGAHGAQNLLLLTKIPLSSLEFHRAGQEDAGNAEYYKEMVLEHVKQELAYVSNWHSREGSVDARVRTRKNTKNKHKIPDHQGDRVPVLTV